MSIKTSRIIVLLVSLLAILLVGASSALAEEPHPGFEVTGRFGPTELSPGGKGVLFLYVYNTGAGEVQGTPTLVDKLPEGLEAVKEIPAISKGNPPTKESAGCSGTKEIICEVAAIAPVGKSTAQGAGFEKLEIPVVVLPSASGVSAPVDLVSVSGGGALGVARARVPVVFGSGLAPLGFANVDGWLSNADGTTDTQAGSHPYSLTVVFAMNSEGYGSGAEVPTVGEMHALNVNLPPGLVGEPGAVPECTREKFDGEACPESSLIGENTSVLSGNGLQSEAIYNMVPPPGIAAQFAFNFGGVSIFLDSGVRSGGDNGITTHVNPFPQRKIVWSTTTIWGFPGKVHAERSAAGRGEESHETAAELAQAGQRPLLTLPTSCGAPQTFGYEELGTWQEEDPVAHENDPLFKAQASVNTHNNADQEVGFTGCEKLVHFQPTLEAAPDTSNADMPAGLTATLRVPQNVNPEGLATAGLKDTTVVLPEGMVINPGQATGLQACQPDQDGLGHAANGEVNEGPPSCPAASKVGTDEIVTPLLAHALKGDVYVLQSNPPEVKLLVAASGEGVNLKLVGTVHLNRTTGQLTTTFENTPDAPFTEFKLAFSGGAQAALATPTTCGEKTSTAAFMPWSALDEAFDTTSFQISAGTGGSACPGQLPFSPVLTAGATTDQAGGYTNFSLLLTRGDDQQRIDGLQFKAPKGLTGFISKVPLCTNAQAESNTCPEASKIGHSVVESGPGPYPLVIPETGQPPAPIYLTETYDGAPFGLSIVVPIHAGPFTLPTQRVHAKIEVDPTTSALTVTTDPLPQVVEGIPTDLREVDAVIERPEFMVNPTNCDPQAFTGTAYGAAPPGVSEPGDSAPLSYRFQVGACQALKFQPKFSVSASGENSKAEGASLTAKVSYPNVPQGTDADITKFKVELPKQLPSRLTTLQKACLAKVFEANPASCSPESFIGHVVVQTPLLPVPLIGPAIFVSHGSEAFPSLTLVLQGDGVTVDIVGTTFISKAGITSTTFNTVPDAPFSSFELSLPQGKFSALAANGNLCALAKTVTTAKKETKKVKGKTKKVTVKVKETVASSLVMPTEIIGQNGAEIHESSPIRVMGCLPASKKAHKAKAKKKTKARKHGKNK